MGLFRRKEPSTKVSMRKFEREDVQFWELSNVQKDVLITLHAPQKKAALIPTRPEPQIYNVVIPRGSDPGLLKDLAAVAFMAGPLLADLKKQAERGKL